MPAIHLAIPADLHATLLAQARRAPPGAVCSPGRALLAAWHQHQAARQAEAAQRREKALAAMHAHWEGIDAWYRATPSQRVAQRMVRPGWWVEPTDTYDRATAMLPGLMRKRLDDLGFVMYMGPRGLGELNLAAADINDRGMFVVRRSLYQLQ